SREHRDLCRRARASQPRVYRQLQASEPGRDRKGSAHPEQSLLQETRAACAPPLAVQRHRRLARAAFECRAKGVSTSTRGNSARARKATRALGGAGAKNRELATRL